MCGICGFVNYRSQNKNAILNRMTDILVHRGPDDTGTIILEKGAIGLGHRRLSIIDLSERGRQPMSNEDGSLWITYNGEIYNFKEIRKILEQKGHIFKSSTDTEVIIHSYEEWGIDCINKFIGMFAFAIWDSHRERLFLARDRLGIKPLYYTLFKKECLAFASEIKSLLMIPEVDRQASLKNIINYVLFLWSPDSATPFEGIFKLLPGYYLVYEHGSIKTVSYWDIEFKEEKHHEEFYKNKILELLEDSVKFRLISDVSLGMFLSGGVDSSLILAIMKKFSKENTITYTVGFGKEQLKYDICSDDIYYSRIVKDFIRGVNYNEILLEPDVAKVWPKVVWHMDEPIGDPAALSTYLICKAAKEKATVMLSGMGGEEIFGGYPRYLAMKLSSRYSYIFRLFNNRFLFSIINSLPASKPGMFMEVFRNLKKFLKSANLPFSERYLGYFSYYSQDELKKLIKGNDYFTEIKGLFIEKYFKKADNYNFLNRILYVDQKTFLPSLNLTYTDKASMAASVEVRVPLLDHRLVEFSACVPPDYKIRGLKQKYILKKAAERFLPKEVVWRKKAGFGAPVRAWVKNKKIKEMIYDLLSKESINRRAIFNYAEINKILNNNFTGREDNALQIWELLTLEIWFRTFIDSDGRVPIS